MWVTFSQNKWDLRHGAGLASQVVVGLNIVLHGSNHQIVVVASTPDWIDKVPCTSITIFISIRVEPCIQHWVSGSFNNLMSNGSDSTIHIGIAIGRCVLGVAATSSRRHTNPSVLDVSIVGMPATELSAETRLGYVTEIYMFVLKLSSL